MPFFGVSYVVTRWANCYNRYIDDSMEFGSNICNECFDDYRAFWLFKRHFPAAGEALFLQLDGAAQRAVEKEGGAGAGSRHGSSDSLHQSTPQPPSSMPRPLYGKSATGLLTLQKGLFKYLIERLD